MEADVVFTQGFDISVGGAELSGNQITFNGLGFPTSDYTARAVFNGLEASTVDIVSSVQVVATWDTTGLPAATDIPVLQFVSTIGDFSMFAINAVELTKELELVSTSSDLSCSFAGGCTYAVESQGLYATLLDSNNRIDICGNTCELQSSLSDSSYAVCSVPALETEWSADNYAITESAWLYGTVFPEDSVLHDDEH